MMPNSAPQPPTSASAPGVNWFAKPQISAATIIAAPAMLPPTYTPPPPKSCRRGAGPPPSYYNYPHAATVRHEWRVASGEYSIGIRHQKMNCFLLPGHSLATRHSPLATCQDVGVGAVGDEHVAGGVGDHE